MADLFKAKLRKVGTSLGVILPHEKINQAHLEEGEEVEVALLSHKKDFSGFGMAKHFSIPFRRDKKVRTFS